MNDNERPPDQSQPYQPQQQHSNQYYQPNIPYSPYHQMPPPFQAPVEKKQSYGFIIATIILSILLVVAFFIIVAMSLRSMLATNTYDAVAKVNGIVINEEQLLLSLIDSYPDTLVDEIDYLIRNEVLAQEAKAREIKVLDKDLEDELAAEKIYFGTAEDFEDYLYYYDMTESQYKHTLNYSATIRLLLQSKVVVSDEEVREYYEQNKNNLGLSAEKIRASQIVVEDYELAQQIVSKLQNGSSFINLAREYSTDYSAEDGGDLGYITYDYLIEELSKAAFALEINELSDIVSTYEGYHILLKTDYLKAIPAAYEDVAHGIRLMLINQKINEQYSTYVDDLVDAAQVESIVEDYYDSYYDEYYYEHETKKLTNPHISF